MTTVAPSFRPDSKRKVLLVGWDAADWKMVAPLIDAGKMPNLEKLIERGVMGNLATLYPVLSPMLWTSISTGKRAWKHGIHGFSEPDPDTGGVRPITNLGRRCKSIWNILNQCGLQSNVIGWWPSFPAEPINGIMVADQFKSPNKDLDTPWPMRRGMVHPPELSEHVANYRIHPYEIEGEQLLPFVPGAADIDQQQDKRLISVAKCVAECSSVHAVATAAMQLEPWDFMAVYYDAIDHFSHSFMKYHPPRLDWIPEADFELYKDVMNGAYQYHDMMLGTLLELAGEETTVILMSDHGFHSDHLRPKLLPNEPAGPADEHRHFGMLVAAGPGIKKDELVFGASLLDIAPTILTLFDLPVGRDMDGGPIRGAFEEPPAIEYIDSWEEIPGNDGQHPPDLQLDPVENQQALQQLVDLGYIEKLDEDQEVAVKETVRELRYNLARAYQGAGRNAESLQILEQLWELYPEEHRFGVHIFRNALKLRRVQRAREVLEQIRENKHTSAQTAIKELAQFQHQLEADEKDPNDLEEDQRHEFRKLQRRAATNIHTFHFLEGQLLLAEGKPRKALEQLNKADQVQVHNRPDLLRTKGDVLLTMRRWKAAESEFRAVHDIDPGNAAACLGLTQSLLPQRRYEEALAAAQASVGIMYHQPLAHFFVGVALSQLQRFDEATKAMETAVQQNPAFPQAHRRLARLHTGLGSFDKAAHHRKLEEQARQRQQDFYAGKSSDEREGDNVIPSDAATLGELGVTNVPGEPLDDETVVIVSGLPRSGTSMMMQMLDAGGLRVFADEHRPADESNPKGYFEHQDAGRLGVDNAWMSDAGGTAVKIVAQLLPRLPQHYKYRIIFMERPLSEVVASQSKLLHRLDKKGGDLTDAQLARMFQQQIVGVRNVLQRYSDSVSVLSVDYNDALSNPQQTVAKVNSFLGSGLNVASMIASIDPGLRNEGTQTQA